MKNPLTAEIEPATFRFVTQHLNHCATAVPQVISYLYKFKRFPLMKVIKIANRLPKETCQSLKMQDAIPGVGRSSGSKHHD